MLAKGLIFGRSERNRKKLKVRKYSTEKNRDDVNFDKSLDVQSIQKASVKGKSLFLNTTIHDLKSIYEVAGEQLATNSDPTSIYHSFETYTFDSQYNIKTFKVMDTDIQLISKPDNIWGAYNDFSFEHYLNPFCVDTSYFPLVNDLPLFPFNYDTTEYSLFEYFVKKICPVCICYSERGIPTESDTLDNSQSDKINPYLKYIVPLGMKSELLFKTIVAVAANELNIVQYRSFYEDIARNSMSYVLKELPKLINNRKFTNSNNWDEILATILMLCFADISSECGRMWILHLNGAKEFIRYLIDGQVEGELSKFVVRYFISHEIMGQTAWSDQQNNLRWDPFFEDLKYDYDTNIDLVLGCSPYLISLINSITMLGDYTETLDFGLKHTRDSIQSNILKQRDRLEFELVNLEQKLTVEETNESAVYVQRIAKVKKIAAILYLFIRVDQELYFTLGKGFYRQYHLRLKNMRPWVLEAIDIMNNMNTSSMSLLWPLFIVGVVSYDDEDHRHFVLHRLQEMEMSRKLASVRMAKHTIETLWKEKDLGCLLLKWKDMMRGRADTISLA